MGNAITQDARAIWLMLVSDGSWWSANSLTHHWRPTFALHEVQDHLNALNNGGFITNRAQFGTAQFAFTSDCQQLPGAATGSTLSINTRAIQ